MCGICGVINFSKVSESAREKIKVINKGLSHRGPDNEGFYNDVFVSLGHRRLSIVDLSENSNQPMSDNKDDIIIVFNGEIYNSDEIKKDLTEFDFKTSHSDTEVIIYAYKKWGVDAFKKFSGMFAICIYDKKIKKSFLFRDRLGKKPLYYTNTTQGDFYFSSEINPLFDANVLKKEVNQEAIYHYLTILTVNAPNTFFKGVSKLEMGCYLEIDINNKITSKKYWDISDYINSEVDDSEEQVLEKTERLLDKSMEYRNISDVPISLALSGGLDSSLNLEYSSRNLDKQKIFGINISYEKTSEYDESVIAKRFTEERGVDFISKKIDDETFASWIKEYLSIQKDAPSGDINTSLVYGMSNLARNNGAKVLLVGEGGDELGGYPLYNTLFKYQKIFSLLPAFVLRTLAYCNKKIKREFDIYVYGKNIGIRRSIYGFREYEKKKFWLKGKSYNTYDILNKYANQIKIKSNDAFFRRILNVEYKVRLSELILPRIDYPSMASSIEARSPFMDYKLIEYMASVPFEVKMKNKEPKHILKKIGKKRLPEYITNHPKVGFGQMLLPFFNDTLPEWYKEEILEKDSPLYEYISKDFLKKIYTNKDYSYRMWLLYSLHRWLKENI